MICLLDACRYDIFEKVNWLPGQLGKVISAGSTTVEWAVNTFTGRYPAVYLSSIPYIAASIRDKRQAKFIGMDHFDSVVDVWDWGYDEEKGTVMPDTIVEAAIAAARDNPEKSIVAHFIQPHSPYIGSPELTDAVWTGMHDAVGLFLPSIENIFDEGYGELLIEAYVGNLVAALKSVERLVAYFDRITITADHGEGFGESGVYGHGEGIRVPELVEVPFFDLTL